MTFRLCVSTIIVLISLSSSAKVRYWVGNGTDTNWNSTTNWSASSGGSSGATVPATNDTTHFDSGGTGNCVFNIDVSNKYFIVSSGYTGTISQGTQTFTIGNKGASFNGGTFSGGSASISSTGPFAISGTSFTSTSATFSFADDFTISSGSFAANGGNMKFSKTCTISGSATFEDLEFNGVANAAYSIATGTTLTVNGELKLGATSNYSLLGGTIDAKGDITVTNTSSGGSRTTQLNITGTANQILTGSGVAATGYLPSIVINKTGGTLTLNSIISVLGDWVYTAGTVDAITNNSTVLINGSILDGEGGSSTMQFSDVSIYATVTLSGKLKIGGNLKIYANKTLNTNSSGSFEIDLSGTLQLYGDFIANSNLFRITGTGNKYIQGNDTAEFYKLFIEKASGSITLQTPVTVNDTLSLTNGIIINDTSDILTIDNGALVVGGSSSSYVNGAIKKIGNSAFIFPLGISGKFRPMEISAPVSSSEEFLGRYYNSIQERGDTLDSLVNELSDCEYWKLDHPVGNSPVTVRLSWGNPNCLNSTVSSRIVAWWNATNNKWESLGASEIVGVNHAGSALSYNEITGGYLTIASKFTGFYSNATVVDQDGATLGSISLDPVGGSTPYSYNWFNGATTSTLSNLPEGQYAVTITDSRDRVIQKRIAVGRKMLWEEIVTSEVSASGSTLTKNGSNQWCDGKAESENRGIINDTAWIEFKTTQSSLRHMVGIVGIDTTTEQEITYRLFLQNDTIFSVFIDNDDYFERKFLDTCTVGDVLKIEFDGEDVSYYKNEYLMLRRKYFNSADVIYRVVGDIYNETGSISGIRTSFGTSQ